MHIVFDASPWLVPLALGLAAAAVLAYRNTLPEVSERTRAVLRALRIAAYAGVVLVLLDPRIVRTVETRRAPRVVVLVDRSASMRLPAADGRSARFDRARELAGRLCDEVERRGGACDALAFASRVTWTGADTVTASGQGTRVLAAVRDVAGRYADDALSAIVVLSDGVDTSDPLLRPAPPRVPVFAVGLGDTASPPDVALDAVDYPSIVRTPSRATVRAELAWTGSGTRRVTVRLREGRRTIARRDTVLTAVRRHVEVALPVRFTRPGRRAMRLEVDAHDSDDPPANNARDVVIDAEKARTRVVFVDATPDWEFAFLSDALRRDPTFAVDLVTIPGPSGRRPGRVHPPEAFETLLEDADAVVLRTPGDAWPASAWDALERFVRRRGGGLLVLPGPGSVYERPAAWDRLSGLLPLRGRAPMRFAPGYTVLVPGAAASAHAITARIAPLLAQSAWQERSPLLGAYRGVSPAPGAEVLATVRGSGTPAIAAARVGRGRVVAVSAGPLWRWRFVGGDPTVYDEFVARLFHVLARGDENGRFVLRGESNVFEAGERVGLVAELYNERMQPVTGVPVVVEVARVDSAGVETPVTRAPMTRDDARSARFGALVGPLAPGRYVARARAEVAGREMVSSPLRFRVSRTSVEFRRTAQDRSLLAALALRTGGRYRHESVDGLVAEMDLAPRVSSATRETVLRARAPLFVLVVLLLSAEWLLRKRAGLL